MVIMGYSDSTLRVVPYLQWWQIAAVVTILMLLVVAVVQLVAIRKALEAIPQDVQASIVAATRQLVAEDKAREEKEAKEAALKEFGPLTQVERNAIEVWGIDKFRASRAAKALSDSDDYSGDEKEALRVYGPTVADHMRSERKSKAEKGSERPSFLG
jgi:hypothetical protein